MSYFAYRLVPPRPSFAGDMSDSEAATMAEHAAYWLRHVESGRALIFGPVADPAGTWGLAVVAADAGEDVVELGEADPAVASGVCTFDALPMPGAVA